ncbi:hypothetical protein BGZ73_007725 [Actinomortierella ambigua]|nr:hypothetical protein BGZ73_007725 [Actinomortierella ambigua]
MAQKKEISEFKRRMANQPVIQRAVVQPLPAHEMTPLYTGSDANPNNHGPLVISSSKKRKAEVYSQPKDTGTGRHTNSLLFAAIKYLRDAEEPQTAEDIRRKGNVDLEANPELYQALKDSSKIDYDMVSHTFQYRPTYNIKSKEDLLALLEKNKNVGGMEYKELKDSYSKLPEAVRQLAEEGKILVIKTKDGQPRVLYWNDVRYNTAMDREFRDIWHRMRVPDETDLPKELVKAGLAHMQVHDKKGPGEVKKQKTARKNRRMKITNTHMKDLDLTKDFVATK